MTIQTPPEVTSALSAFASRIDAFKARDVERAVEKAIEDQNALTPEARRGWWAEWAAFGFSTHGAPGDGPWKTYFQPLMTATRQDGTMVCRPDLGQADADVLAYWGDRAKVAKHPVLVARYADLVWDVTEFVTQAKRGRDKFEFVLLAIDSYIAASRMDDGAAWGDTHGNLTRALQLALSIKDAVRIAEAVNANIEYVEKTADDDKIGTYCYLFDNLLPPGKGPELTGEQEREIIKMFEAKFAEMTTPGGQWDVDPHSPRDIGVRLAAYYHRKEKPEERMRVLCSVAQAFERRAKMGEPMTGMFFLADARSFYLDAGLQDEAERVQLEAQKMGPAAQEQLVPMTVKQEIPTADVDKFLDGLMEGGMDNALLRLTLQFIPDQTAIAKQAEEIAKDHPLFAIISGSAKMLGDGHIEADIGDDTGDPDGKMVYQTSRHIQLESPWLAWAFGRMVSEGLCAAKFVEFVRKCALFSDDRLKLIRQGVEAHFMGDYAQAIHLLIPQIERSLVSVLPMAGKPSNKAHRSGRGVMQFKNLNDVLAKDEWTIPEESGEDLRMYLLTALAHPKGMNIRNDVCHGLWPTDHFTQVASERVLHVLLAVSMLRPSDDEQPNAT